MKIAIIQFPGSNCESESIRAIKQAGMEAEEFLWNQNPDELKNFDGFFIVGGFSYEDRSRSGIISSLDPLMDYIKQENEKGKPILGVCNGAQILVESGIVPGLKDYQKTMALAVNKRIKDNKILGTGFYNAWTNVMLSTPTDSCAFSLNFKENEIMNIPLAHGEGRFIIPEKLLTELISNNQAVFRYCDENGKIHEDFPTNPNGAVYNLAAVCNNQGNAMAIMPHPERTPNGQKVFTSMRDFITNKKGIKIKEINFKPEECKINKFVNQENSTEFFVKLIITDNEAMTVQNALKNKGINVEIKKFNHWEIIPEENVELPIETIKKSGELYNSNKETLTEKLEEQKQNTIKILVRYRDDFVGQSKLDTLIKRFDAKNIKNIKKGILWEIITNDNPDEILNKIIESRILFNEFSQKAWIY